MSERQRESARESKREKEREKERESTCVSDRVYGYVCACVHGYLRVYVRSVCMYVSLTPISSLSLSLAL